MRFHASVLIFLAVLIGFVVSQWSRSWSVETYAKKDIQMLEHEELSESLAEEEKTPWQKYRTRCAMRKLGLETPAAPPSPEWLFVTDLCKSVYGK